MVLPLHPSSSLGPALPHLGRGGAQGERRRLQSKCSSGSTNWEGKLSFQQLTRRIWMESFRDLQLKRPEFGLGHPLTKQYWKTDFIFFHLYPVFLEQWSKYRYMNGNFIMRFLLMMRRGKLSVTNEKKMVTFVDIQALRCLKVSE